MIGHYLLTLSTEQEERVLTRSFGGSAQHCLCMLVGDGCWGANMEELLAAEAFGQREVPGAAYEYLVTRFGAPRVNAAIRNRILSNRARRILQNAPVFRDTEVVESVR